MRTASRSRRHGSPATSMRTLPATHGRPRAALAGPPSGFTPARYARQRRYSERHAAAAEQSDGPSDPRAAGRTRTGAIPALRPERVARRAPEGGGADDGSDGSTGVDGASGDSRRTYGLSRNGTSQDRPSGSAATGVQAVRLDVAAAVARQRSAQSARMAALEADNAELRGEVAHLSRQLEEAREQGRRDEREVKARTMGGRVLSIFVGSGQRTVTRLQSRQLMAAVLRRGRQLNRPRRQRLKLALAYWRQQDHLRRTRR